jgi:hypothetical protein
MIVGNYDVELSSAIRSIKVVNDLVDGQGATPADLDDLDSGAACQAHGVADGCESNEAPVLSVATSQNFTSNRYAGESAGRRDTGR